MLYSRCINFLGYAVHASAYALLAGVQTKNGHNPGVNILLAGIMQLLFSSHQLKHTLPSVTQTPSTRLNYKTDSCPRAMSSDKRHARPRSFQKRICLPTTFKLDRKTPSGATLSPPLNLRRQLAYITTNLVINLRKMAVHPSHINYWR